MEVHLKYTRPAKVKQYAKQVEFIDSPHRFTFVEATSKAGKTVGCLVWLFEQAISPYGWFYPDPNGAGLTADREEQIYDKEGFNYWWVAPSYPVAKIAYRRLKRFISAKELFQANETELSITLSNGAMIFFKGADKPDSLYGEDVYGMVCDEASRTKREAYTAIISTLTATKGLFKAIGNVKGKNNWFYENAHETKGFQDKGIKVDKHGHPVNAAYYLITASDAVEAGVLEQKIIDDAEGRLSHGDFMELYHGIPNVAAANQYAYSFKSEKHVKECKVDTRYPVWLSFDFNINPISCTVIQYIKGVVKIPLVLQLGNSNIYELCKYIKSVIPNAVFMVTGDATGRNSSAMVKDNLNYFRIIRRELRLPTTHMKQKLSNPPTDENQVLVNAVLEHIPHEVDPKGAARLIDDFQTAQVDERGKLLKKDRNKESQQLEALDGYRYWANLTFTKWLKNYRHT